MFANIVKLTQRETSTADREVLLDVAEGSIRSGLREGHPLVVEPTEFSFALRESRASFVTLYSGQSLRGCIGTIEGYRPLVTDVAENAFCSAFHDPRFPPLGPSEYSLLTIQVAVLSSLEPVKFASEAELLRQIRPGLDGLVLECGAYRGLLLPSVWKALPERRQFLETLKIKAGLPPGFWSDRVTVNRFATESFGRKVGWRSNELV